MKNISGIGGVIDYINKHSTLKIKILDLRKERVETQNGIINKRFNLEGDPKGYTIIDLGEKSEFYKIRKYCDKLYGADYDFDKVRKAHNYGRNEYCISNTILESDVIINIPKLKTHKKAGISVCMKNIIGINGDKNYLPHYRFGSIHTNGDEFENNKLINRVFSNILQKAFRVFSKIKNAAGLKAIIVFGKMYSLLNKKNIVQIGAGDWYGNDTIWRTILDLNKIIFFSNKYGVMEETVQRKYVAIVDGVTSGESNGPLFPKSKSTGIIIGGLDPVGVDIVSSLLMGFDYNEIPQIQNAIGLNFTEIDEDDIKNFDHFKVNNFNFEPAEGWKAILNQ